MGQRQRYGVGGVTQSCAFFFLSCIQLLLDYPTTTAGFPFPKETWGVQKRSSEDSPPDPHILLLETLATTLPLEHFSEDLLLIQKLDRVNENSKYLDSKDQSIVIIEHEQLDSNKAAVVVKPPPKQEEDDQTPTKPPYKRTYTVLVRAPPGDIPKQIYYYPVYAYIRDARPSDPPIFVHTTSSGKKVTVEWDIWEPRHSGIYFHTGWLTCHYTTLFSCHVNEQAVSNEVVKIASKALGEKPPRHNNTDGATPVEPYVSIPPDKDNLIIEGGSGEEYLDLYGEFDVIKDDGTGSGKSFEIGYGGGMGTESLARAFGLIPTIPTSPSSSNCKSTGWSFFGKKSCTSTKTPVKAATAWIPALSKHNSDQIPNPDAVFGTYFLGTGTTPPIFIPDGTEVRVTFIPDKEPTAIHGKFTPGKPGDALTFIADQPFLTMRPGSFIGNLILDDMTLAGVQGGIHGTLTGDQLKPDSSSVAMWYNPDAPESKNVWTSYRKPAVPTRPPFSPTGEVITYGIYFAGSGSSDIFVPDGQGITGTFVPSDKAQKVTPHGTFVATKPAGHGTFYPDDMKQLLTINTMRGAFMPDGMNLTGAIAGLATKEGSSFVVVVDAPGTDYQFQKTKAQKNLWTPFLKSGEWAPIVNKAPGGAVGALGHVANPVGIGGKKVNQAFMFGVKFTSTGVEVFVPDDYPVEGLLTLEDSEKYKQPLEGWISSAGKTPDKVTFKCKIPGQLNGVPVNLGMFAPHGTPTGSSVVGMITVNPMIPDTAYFQIQPAGKAYWYIKGKPENAAVWTPFSPPALPPKPTLEQRMTDKPFSAGYYLPSIVGTNEVVFVPQQGGVGCFVADDNSFTSCGTFYPERTVPISKVNKTFPSEFVENTPGIMKPGVSGTFTPALASGAPSPNKFKGTSVAGDGTNPATIKPANLPILAWEMTDVKVQEGGKRNISTETNPNEHKHPSHIGVPVGSGFVGYPTNNRGLDCLLDPINPVFKEYVQLTARDDKTLDQSEKFIVVNRMEEVPFPDPKVYYIKLDLYRRFIEDRYSLKITHIKTLDFDEMIEIAIPKAAEKYVKVKKRIAIKVEIAANSQAGGNANSGGAGGSGTGMGGGGIRGTKGGEDCGAGWSTSANAVAKAENGSSSTAEANAKQGGDANAMSTSKSGGNSTSLANVKDGGKSNAMSQSSNNAAAGSESNALSGGVANALAKKNIEGTSGSSLANAKRTNGTTEMGQSCAGGGLPDEIEVDSHAAASALSTGNGSGTTVNSVANTNVKLDLAGLVAKYQEMHKDDEEDAPEVLIKVDANSKATGNAAGRSFGEEELDPVKQKKASKIGKLVARVGVQLSVGWKTELKPITPNVTLEHENEIFYGLGNCPFSPTTYPASLEPEKVIDFYLTKLRLDCIATDKERIMKLINEGFLQFDEAMKFLFIPKHNKALTRPKIKESEVRSLAAAFEFYIFTTTYHQHVVSSSSKALSLPNEEQDGKIHPATRSVRFLVDFSLNFIEQSRTLCPAHYVRLTRNLLTSIRSVMLKLFQDGLAVEGCAECSHDQETNFNDQVHLIGLLQYIIHGIVPFERQETRDLRHSFQKFFTTNKNIFIKRARDYKIQAPK